MRKRVLVACIGLMGVAAACSPWREGVDSREFNTPPPSQISDLVMGSGVDGEVTAEPSPRPRFLRAGELVLAADTDDIPAIMANDDLFVPSREGDREWEDVEPILGVEFNGDSRAYPIRLLSLHEIVNDRVGGRPLLITWCPLCYSAIVFDRVVDRELTFGVSGYLYRNNLVMYDHQSNTLWNQILGQGIRGAYRGDQLEVLPSLLTTWGAWKEAHPETRVLSAVRLGENPDAILDPYVGYYTSGSAGITGRSTEDNRLKVKDLIVGLVAGSQIRAYPLVTIREGGLLNDRLGSLPVLLIFQNKLDTVLAFSRQVDQKILTFRPSAQDGMLVDGQTGTIWDAASGEALEGPLQGSSLSRLNAPLVYWFAWVDIYPQTDVYRP